MRATSSTTVVRAVDIEAMKSLIARLGVMGGVKFNENRGAAYLKASCSNGFPCNTVVKFSGCVQRSRGLRHATGKALRCGGLPCVSHYSACLCVIYVNDENERGVIFIFC